MLKRLRDEWPLTLHSTPSRVGLTYLAVDIGMLEVGPHARTFIGATESIVSEDRKFLHLIVATVSHTSAILEDSASTKNSALFMPNIPRADKVVNTECKYYRQKLGK